MSLNGILGQNCIFGLVCYFPSALPLSIIPLVFLLVEGDNNNGRGRERLRGRLGGVH